jgi:hypothetical protein
VIHSRPTQLSRSYTHLSSTQGSFERPHWPQQYKPHVYLTLTLDIPYIQTKKFRLRVRAIQPDDVPCQGSGTSAGAYCTNWSQSLSGVTFPSTPPTTTLDMNLLAPYILEGRAASKRKRDNSRMKTTADLHKLDGLVLDFSRVSQSIRCKNDFEYGHKPNPDIIAVTKHKSRRHNSLGYNIVLPFYCLLSRS